MFICCIHAVSTEARKECRSLQLELQEVVRYHVATGTHPDHLDAQPMLLTTELSLQLQKRVFFFK